MYAVDYVKQRAAFGRTIADMQGIQWKIAELATEIEAARLLTYRAAVHGRRRQVHQGVRAVPLDGEVLRERSRREGVGRGAADARRGRLHERSPRPSSTTATPASSRSSKARRRCSSASSPRACSITTCGGIEDRRRERDPHSDPRALDARHRAHRETRSRPRSARLLEGRVADIQAAASSSRCARRARPKTSSPRSCARCTRTRRRTSTSPTGAIDTCGTGGDRSGTVNVSTMAALDCGGCAVRAWSSTATARNLRNAARPTCSRSSAWPIELGPDGVARCVAEAGVGFCLAPRYHPAMRFLGPAREGARRADDLQLPRTAREPGPGEATGGWRERRIDGGEDARHIANARRRARDGVPRRRRRSTSSPRRPPARVHELTGRRGPHVHASTRSSSARRAPRSASSSAATRRRTRTRCAPCSTATKGPHRDIAVLNAGAALVVAGLADDLAAGVEPPRSIDRRWPSGARARHDGACERRSQSGRGRLTWPPSSSVPTAGQKHPLGSIPPDVSTFPCKGCGRQLKVPESVPGRSPASAPPPRPAPAPAPAAATPAATRRRRPSPSPRPRLPGPWRRRAPARRRARSPAARPTGRRAARFVADAGHACASPARTRRWRGGSG